VRFRAFAVACVATLAVGSALTAPTASAVTMSPNAATGSSAPKTDRGLPIIRGTVGPGFTISVSRQQAPPGRYRLIVRDRGSMHNWHISGPGGVDRRTGVPFTGRREFTVRLRVGTYRIVCDPHSSQMRTRIVVG
jgi:plastocyanin